MTLIFTDGRPPVHLSGPDLAHQALPATVLVQLSQLANHTCGDEFAETSRSHLWCFFPSVGAFLLRAEEPCVLCAWHSLTVAMLNKHKLDALAVPTVGPLCTAPVRLSPPASSARVSIHLLGPRATYGTVSRPWFRQTRPCCVGGGRRSKGRALPGR